MYKPYGLLGDLGMKKGQIKINKIIHKSSFGFLLAIIFLFNTLTVQAGDANTKATAGAGITYYENGAPYVNELSDVVDNLPYSVKAMLLNDHYVICIVGHNTDIEQFVYNSYGDQGVQGVCVAYPGQTGICFGYIYIETDDPDIVSIYNSREPQYVKQYGMYEVLRRHKTSVLIHEIGHSIYYHNMIAIPDYENMVAQVYSAEKSNFYTTLYHTELSYDFDSCYNQYEYFAEAFACYYLYPQELASKCPLTYQFINNNLSSLNNEFPVP